MGFKIPFIFNSLIGFLKILNTFPVFALRFVIWTKYTKASSPSWQSVWYSFSVIKKSKLLFKDDLTSIKRLSFLTKQLISNPALEFSLDICSINFFGFLIPTSLNRFISYSYAIISPISPISLCSFSLSSRVFGSINFAFRKFIFFDLDIVINDAFSSV